MVCSLHFTDGDYKKSTKLKILLPTAVPTVFSKLSGVKNTGGSAVEAVVDMLLMHWKKQQLIVRNWSRIQY